MKPPGRDHGSNDIFDISDPASQTSTRPTQIALPKNTRRSFLRGYFLEEKCLPVIPTGGTRLLKKELCSGKS